MKRRLRVYIAGPITSSGNLTANVRNGLLMKRRLMKLSFLPFCPHESEFVNLVRPLTWEEWLSYDEGWIEVCDAILRLPGFSRGAEREEAFAGERRIPVFKSLKELLTWRRKKFTRRRKRTSPVAGRSCRSTATRRSRS